MTALPGLCDVLAEELREVSPVRAIRPVPGRTDALLAQLPDPADLLALRTAVGAFTVRTFAVPRPKELLRDEHFAALLADVRRAQRLAADEPLQTVRIDAAGADSPVLRRLRDRIAAEAGLQPAAEGGDCVLRIRRAVEGEGWDVLVRLSRRPLSTRPWRVAGYPAALNATIAAAMVRLSGPRPTQRVANLMCGSGTLLIERLLAAPAAVAVGVDRRSGALDAATTNAAAAGLTGAIDWRVGDVGTPDWRAAGPFDVVFADPPWGDKAGRHATNEAAHALLLDAAAATTTAGGQLVVVSHEIAIMRRQLARADQPWRETAQLRVFAKGHHPRIYLLQRRS